MLEELSIVNNRYRLTTKLGDRASRQTWLADDLQTGDRVVVKLLAFGVQVDWEALKLFEREATILNRLDFSYIPKCRDYFTIDDRVLWFGLVEDYIAGISLDRAIDNGQVFTEERVKQIAIEILAILDYLHNLEPPILHRDLKPSNLILDPDDRLYLIDFGAVQDRTPIEGVTFTVAGTYGYTPMEQFSGRAIPASDLYALGATIVHLLTGIAPANLPQRELRLQFRDLVTIDRGFARWLDRLLCPSPEHRYQTAKEALTHLQSPHLSLPAIVPKPTYTSIEIDAKDPHKLIVHIPLDRQLKLGESLAMGIAKVFNAPVFIILSLSLIYSLFLANSLALAIVYIFFVLFSFAGLFVLFLLQNDRRAADKAALGADRQYCVLRLDRSTFQIADNYHTKDSTVRELIGSTVKIDRIEIENSWRGEPPRHKTIAIVTTDNTFVLPAKMTIQECQWLCFAIESWL